MNPNVRTLRGRVQEGEIHRLILDDGLYTNGYKIKEFYVFKTPNSTTHDVYGCLGLSSNAFSGDELWDAGNNLQIGWAGTRSDGTASPASPFSLVDPNHIVNRDLFIQLEHSGSGGTQMVSYLVIIEPVEMTEPQAVLQLIKERAQDDLR